MKKILQKISRIFESRATVFFATLALMLYLNPVNKNEKEVKPIPQEEEIEIHENENIDSESKIIPEVAAASHQDMAVIKCFSGNLKESDKFNQNVPWSTEFMENDFRSILSRYVYSNNIEKSKTYYDQEKNYMSNFDKDLNGDGLPDYIYIDRSHNQYQRDCVFLSNGQGWSLAYRCLKINNQGTNYKWRYYGDCADTST